jgi:propanediol utilization protein
MSVQLDQIIDTLCEKIIKKIDGLGNVEIEASGRHVHLSRKEVEDLFGENHQLTKAKELSQPGQYACKERLTLTGPKGSISGVVILGPEREQSQIELSKTDARILGIDAPLRASGDLQDTPGLELSANGNQVKLDEGVIIADRHIHMKEDDAHVLSLANGDRVDVEVETSRPMLFRNVKVRVSDRAETYMHIDYDEANACGLDGRTFGSIVVKP